MEIKRNVYRQRIYEFKNKTGRKPTEAERELLKKYTIEMLLNIERFLKEDLEQVYKKFNKI